MPKQLKSFKFKQFSTFTWEHKLFWIYAVSSFVLFDKSKPSNGVSARLDLCISKYVNSVNILTSNDVNLTLDPIRFFKFVLCDKSIEVMFVSLKLNNSSCVNALKSISAILVFSRFTIFNALFWLKSMEAIGFSFKSNNCKFVFFERSIFSISWWVRYKFSNAVKYSIPFTLWILSSSNERYWFTSRLLIFAFSWSEI